MDFFMRIKRKMRNSNIIFAIIGFVLSIIWLSEVFSTGFSSDKDYTYTLRGLGIELPVPNWLLSAFFLVLGLGALAATILCLVVLIKGKDFNEFINMTSQYGNVEYIGNILENTPVSPYIKFGELRLNKLFFFYISSGVAKIYPTQYITSVEQKIKKRKYQTDYFVRVTFKNDVIEIQTKKDKIALLLREFDEALQLQ